MRKRLFSVLAALLVFGCGGDMDNLPCLTCGEQPSSSSSYRSSSSPSMVSSSSSAGLSACSGGTVQIGSQVWQKCNLNVAPAAGTGNSWCYDNDPANCTIYGRLYDWAAAMALPSDCNSTYCADQINEPHRGICPSGWHVPSNEDWAELFDYVGGSSGKLKSTSGWHDCGPSGSGNSYLCEDTHRFSALPGGGGSSDGIFYNAGYSGIWWRASEFDAYIAYSRFMDYNGGGAGYSVNDKSLGFSVRCLQDCDNCGGGSSSSVAKSSSSSVAKSSSSSAPPSSSSVAQSSSSAGLSACSGGTVTIGSQVWQKCNSNSVPSTGNSTCYDNDPANCAIYGRLYDWAAAMALPSSCNSADCSSQIGAKHQGICPSGWHIPSGADWNVLMKFVNPVCSDNNNCIGVGTKLKASSGWNDYNRQSGNGTDAYGFSALPGGRSLSDGYFDVVGYASYWWSSSEDTAIGAYLRYLGFSDDIAYWGSTSKSVLLSVRCLQD